MKEIEEENDVVQNAPENKSYDAQYTLESDTFIYDHRFIKLKDFVVIPAGTGGVYRGQMNNVG